MATPSVITDVTGNIQKYFEAAWMDLPQQEFRTPLADEGIMEKAVIPKNKGTYAEFRLFNHFTVPTLTGVDGSGGDSPKTYSENAEPAAAASLSAAIYQVSFEMVANWFQLGNVAAATDPIDLMKKAKEEMALLIRRTVHQLTNDRFVRPITANVLNASASPTPLPAPFKTIYANGVAGFGGLQQDSFFTSLDFKRARMLLRNANMPGVFGEKYAAFVTEAVLAQLQEDPTFKDQTKRHEDMLQKTIADGGYVDWEGMRFILQDDGYRANLPAAGGALTTRANTGAVHVAHVLGKYSAGYVDFGGANTLQRRTLMPKFHVIDTSKTGTGPSVGFRMPYQAIVMDSLRGVNIAGTSEFDEAIADI